MARWILVSALPLIAACYSYVPIDPGGARPNMDVRLRISAAEGDRIAPLLGTQHPRVLTGIVVDTGNKSMIVEVPTSSQVEAGGYLQTLHQRVSIPRSDLVELESRTLDRFRTGVVVGAAVVATTVATVKAFHAIRSKENQPGGGGTDALFPVGQRIP